MKEIFLLAECWIDKRKFAVPAMTLVRQTQHAQVDTEPLPVELGQEIARFLGFAKMTNDRK